MAEHTPEEYCTLSNAELTAFAHLYRGEVYRSTVWRQRLDISTNWAVVTLGIALSITFASPAASPLPLMLVGILIIFFLMLEARRYRYFNVWRARCRWMETHFFVPMLEREAVAPSADWQKVLANDYLHPEHHISMPVAIGRRVRRNYMWILLIQSAAYLGKLLVHPVPLTSLQQFHERAAIGPVHGAWILTAGTLYVMTFALISVLSWYDDRSRARRRGKGQGGMG